MQIRSRYCEDRLLASGHTQYVILGAGLDSFAWRKPELLRSLRVFEVDHPATQAWKQARASELGLPTSPSHVYVPAALRADDVERALVSRGFDCGAPAVLSCVGTTMYLAAEAMSAMLKCVANCARGSELAFSYNVTREFMDAQGIAFLTSITPKLADQGEPVVTGFAPSAVETLISQHGLSVVDHPTSDELFRRYCADRGEPIRPYTVERLMTARRS